MDKTTRSPLARLVEVAEELGFAVWQSERNPLVTGERDDLAFACVAWPGQFHLTLLGGACELSLSHPRHLRDVAATLRRWARGDDA